jgi:hypothetical protein
LNTQTETIKQVAIVELKDLGYNSSEIGMFKETTVCPRCGHDFSNQQSSVRWVAHFTNCKGK